MTRTAGAGAAERGIPRDFGTCAVVQSACGAALRRLRPRLAPREGRGFSFRPVTHAKAGRVSGYGVALRGSIQARVILIPDAPGSVLFMLSINNGDLLCARHRCKCCGDSREQDRLNPCLHGVDIRVGEDGRIKVNMSS